MKAKSISRRVSLVLGVGLVFAAAGCNRQEDDDFLEALPEQSALQLELTGDSDAEGTTSLAAEEALSVIGESTHALAGGVAPYLDGARNAIRDLNQALKHNLQPIAALIRDQAPQTQPGQVRMWGPVTRGAADYRFMMRRGLVRNRFGWVLEVRPTGSADDAWKPAAAGAITVGQVIRRGVGHLGINLDNLGAADPIVKARGKLLVGFAHGPLGSTLAYGFRAFTPDPARRQPIDALVQGVHLKVGRNLVRLAFHGNVADSPTAAEEIVLARVRHARGIGGRSDLIATQGDVPAGRVFVINECWDAGAAQRFILVRDCPVGGIGDGQCTVLKMEGRPLDCAPGMQTEELPPPMPTDPMSLPDADPSAMPPADMPDGSGV